VKVGFEDHWIFSKRLILWNEDLACLVPHDEVFYSARLFHDFGDQGIYCKAGGQALEQVVGLR
jgi:hypothetical protein